MSNPFFRYPKFWTEALNVLPLLAFCLYALSFSETAGVEAAVIRVFVVFGLFLTYPTKKLVFSENPRRKRWFAVLYTPHLLFGVWLSYWGLHPRAVPLPAVSGPLHSLLLGRLGLPGPARRG